MSYGVDHSKQYKPSVVAPFLREADTDGSLVKVHSDIHLLLRQKSLQRSIGVDSLRAYFDGLVNSQGSSMSTDQLSDDQLFELIPPKSVNNLTTRYEWAQYLQDHEKELKAKLSESKKFASKQKELNDWLKSLKDKPDKSD